MVLKNSLRREIVQGENFSVGRSACGKRPEPWRDEIGGKAFLQLLENLWVGDSGKFGDSGKPVDSQRIFCGDCREQTLADGIPGKGFVRVTFVFSKIQPKSLCVGEKLFLLDGKERSDDAVFSTGLYALKPLDVRSAQNPHQDGFRLVVCMVRGEDLFGANVRSPGDFVQGPVARDSSVFFEGTARFQEFSVKMSEKEGNV